MSGSESDTDDPPVVVSLRNGRSAWRQTREGGIYVTRDDPHAFVDSRDDARRFVGNTTALEITAVGLDEILSEHGDDIVPIEYGEMDNGSVEQTVEPEPADESGPEYPVLEKTVPQIDEALATGEYDDDLDALEAAEESGDDRLGVMQVIDSRRDDLSASETETAEQSQDEAQPEGEQ